jgi:hypothetical protein
MWVGIPANLTEVLSGFPPSIQANVMIVFYFRP